jgi:MFS family permease
MFVAVNSFFVKPLSNEFGWSRGEIAMIGLATLLTPLILPLTGAIADRRGIRPLVAIGALAFAGAYAASAAMTGAVWQCFAILALIALVGGPCTIPFIFCRPVVVTFDRSRGLALAVAMCGVPLASLVILPALQHIIEVHGWRAGFLFLAPISFLLGLLSFLLLKHTPAREGSGNAGAASTPNADSTGLSFGFALRYTRFWLLALSMASVNIIVGVMLSSMQPMLADMGVNGPTAAMLGVCYVVSVVIGRLVFGLLLDRLWPPLVGGLAFAAPFIGLLILTKAGSNVPLLALALFITALPDGSETPILSVLTSRYFGLKAFGAVTGVLGATCAMAFAIGAMVAGNVFDRYGSYGPALVAGMFLALLSGAAIVASGFVGRGAAAGRQDVLGPVPLTAVEKG